MNRHGYKLFLPTCHSSTRFNFFAHRVLRIWNVLPHDMILVRLQVSNVLLAQTFCQKKLKVYFNLFQICIFAILWLIIFLCCMLCNVSGRQTLLLNKHDDDDDDVESRQICFHTCSTSVHCSLGFVCAVLLIYIRISCMKFQFAKQDFCRLANFHFTCYLFVTAKNIPPMAV